MTPRRASSRAFAACTVLPEQPRQEARDDGRGDVVARFAAGHPLLPVRGLALAASLDARDALAQVLHAGAQCPKLVAHLAEVLANLPVQHEGQGTDGDDNRHDRQPELKSLPRHQVLPTLGTP